MRHCHFIAPALSRKHCCLRCAAVDPDMAAFSSTRTSTKDKKKECAYDSGALNNQGTLKKQTLRYSHRRHSQGALKKTCTFIGTMPVQYSGCSPVPETTLVLYPELDCIPHSSANLGMMHLAHSLMLTLISVQLERAAGHVNSVFVGIYLKHCIK